MIKLNAIVSPYSDPFINQSIELYLTENSPSLGCALFLWRNERTVVIGKNQNSRRECRINSLEADGGRLARRITGGGAVYHDLNNLNFSFCVPNGCYDEKKQFSVIIEALKPYGITAEIGGRNDLLIGSEKFSGNAFYHSHESSLHHGTILINTDIAAMEKYLSPSEKKLEANGVRSVAARVINLSSLNKAIDANSLTASLLCSLESVYGVKPSMLESEVICKNACEKHLKMFGSTKWRYSLDPPCSVRLCKRFPFGEIELLLDVKHGAVSSCRAYSDMLDTSVPVKIEEALTGCFFSKRALSDAIAGVPCSNQIISMLSEI